MRPRWRPPSIRAALAVLIAGCTVPAALFTALLLYDVFDRTLADFNHNALELAQVKAQLLDDLAVTHPGLPFRSRQAFTPASGTPWATAIFDQQGRMVAGVPLPGPLDGAQVLRRRRQCRALTGTFSAVAANGLRVQLAYASAPRSGYLVVTAVPRALLYADLRRKCWIWAGLGGVLAALACCVAWCVSAAIGGAARGLLASTRSLAHGLPVPAASYGLKEADQVGAALASAAAALSASRHQAMHDSLTGLANRAMLLEFLQQQCNICQRGGTPLAVLYLDLDDFKEVNDRHGHAVGDRVLLRAADRLRQGLRRADLAARIGGDEFVIVLVGGSAEATLTLRDKLVAVMARPYQIGTLTLRAGASIGHASLTPGHGNAAALLEAADRAMYEHKFQRRNS